MTLFEGLDLWQAALDNVVPTVGECMLEQKEQIIALNTNQMYEMGVDDKGSVLPAYKDPAYAAMKLQMRGQSITDLYLTGSFQSQMNLSLSGDDFVLNSTDSKSEMLRHNYGKRGYDIFGLTDDNKQAAWGVLQPVYIEKLKEQTGAL